MGYPWIPSLLVGDLTKSKASDESSTWYAALAAALCSKCIGWTTKPSQRNSMFSASTT